MTVELSPVGMACNLACGYCYEHEVRDAGNAKRRPYDMEAMKAGLAAELGDSDRSFTLHGGEPLLMAVEDLEEIWRWGFERAGKNGIQTNGALLTDRHVELAQRYGVHIGVSIDGPGEMNDLRWAGSLEKTREATEKSEAAIRRLCEAGVGCSVIVVLHRLNMAPERRAEFKTWIEELDEMGVRGIRFHPMEVDHEEVGDRYQPSIAEYIEFYRDLHEWMKGLRTLRIDVMQDVRALLTGQDQRTTCTWNACDPLTTSAVHGVDGQGNRTNCGRTYKDGVVAVKGDERGYERNIALYHTPQEHGGCQGCRFFAMCKGQCPGEGINGDWRNRSSYCGLYMALFETMEAELLDEGVVPLSLAPRRERVERVMVDHWRRGVNPAVHQALKVVEDGQDLRGQTIGPDGHGDAPHGDSHGDHTDQAGVADPGHGDVPHGDTPHGDGHGDHSDA